MSSVCRSTQIPQDQKIIVSPGFFAQEEEVCAASKLVDCDETRCMHHRQNAHPIAVSFLLYIVCCAPWSKNWVSPTQTLITIIPTEKDEGMYIFKICLLTKLCCTCRKKIVKMTVLLKRKNDDTPPSHKQIYYINIAYFPIVWPFFIWLRKAGRKTVSRKSTMAKHTYLMCLLFFVILNRKAVCSRTSRMLSLILTSSTQEFSCLSSKYYHAVN